MLEKAYDLATMVCAAYVNAIQRLVSSQEDIASLTWQQKEAAVRYELAVLCQNAKEE